MKNCAIVGINWGDEGKGRMVDLLTQAYDVVVRYQGWGCDISGVRTWEDLPKQAQAYVEYLERAIGCHIGYVSVGPERDAYIKR